MRRLFLLCTLLLAVSPHLFTQTIVEHSYDAGYAEQAGAICRTQDGGVALASVFRDTVSLLNRNYALTKLDAQGQHVFTHLFGFGPPIGCEPYKIVQTPDKGFCIAGLYRYYAILLKTDSAGNVQWCRASGDLTYNGILTDVICTSDGAIAVCGTQAYASSTVPDPTDLFVAKYSLQGNSIWRFVYSSMAPNISRPTLTENSNGELRIASELPHNGGRFLLTRLDGNGGVLSCTSYYFGPAVSLCTVTNAPANGNYISATVYDTAASTYSTMLMRTDAAGQPAWSYLFGISGRTLESKRHITHSNGEVWMLALCTGQGVNRMTSIHVNANAGNPIALDHGPSSGFAGGIAEAGNGEIVLSSHHYPNAAWNDLHVSRVEPGTTVDCGGMFKPVLRDTVSLLVSTVGIQVSAPLLTDTLIAPVQTSVSCSQGNHCSIVSVKEPAHEQMSLSAYPNPADENVTFQLENHTEKMRIHLFDALGREIWSAHFAGKISLQTKAYPAGIYFYRLEQEGEVKATGKLMIR